MAIYKYKGVNTNGKTVNGVIEADNNNNARLKLKRQGIYVTQLADKNITDTKNKKNSVERSIGGKVKDNDIVMMTRQFATLINANVPIVDTLGALSDQVENEKLKIILSELRQKVTEGTSLYDGLKDHEKIFTPMYVNMIKAGEASGTLGLVLERLAEYTEKQMGLKNKLISSMAYPILMVIISVLIIAVLFVVVIPKITAIFDSMEASLPIYTEVLIASSNFFKSHILAITMIVAGTIFGIKKYIATKTGKAKWDALKLKLPIFGKIIRISAVSQFAQTLATLQGAGVPLLQSLEIVQSVVDNTVVRKALAEAQEGVSEGESLGKLLAKSDIFPSIVIHMVTVGEKTGGLGEMLEHVSRAYEIEIEAKLETLTSMLEPAMIVVMGGIVSFIVMAILMPIMQMSSMAG